MTTQMKHTQTPWKVEGVNSKTEFTNQVIGEDGSTICLTTFRTFDDGTTDANAAHIVHCVNTHEALKASHERLLEALKDIGYAKSWTVQNQPRDLVSIALKAIKQAESLT